MPIPAQLASIWVGQEPPLNPGPTTRWISTSARHLQVPHTPYERVPIIGSAAGNASATQEISPWYNPTLQRYECLVNTNSSQYFWYADSPLGPWSGGTKVLGTGAGGEASNAQQCMVYVEGTQLYAIYLKSAGATVLTMATAAMPTTRTGVPVFTVSGTIYDNSGVTIADSPWLTKVDNTYLLVTHTQASPRLALTSATSPSGFVASPFTALTGALKNLLFNIGNRYVLRLGRPQLFVENGTAVMYGHILDTVDFGGSQAYRFICNDPFPNLVNWVMDPVQRPFLEQLHPAEIDQIADFRFFQGANDRWFAFWTGADNQGTKFSVMAAPAREPMLAFDGWDWQYTQNLANSGFGPGYINPDVSNTDIITGASPAARVGHLWDAVFRTQSGSLKGTFPPAAAHAKVKITNAPTDVTSTNYVHLLPDSANDKITDGNPITSLTRVGAVVTAVFKYAHNLDLSDFICVTGCVPTAYNTTAQAITSIVDAKTITYTLGADPGANTTIGAIARSVRAGESRAYKCRVAGIWVRD